MASSDVSLSLTLDNKQSKSGNVAALLVQTFAPTYNTYIHLWKAHIYVIHTYILVYIHFYIYAGRISAYVLAVCLFVHSKIEYVCVLEMYICMQQISHLVNLCMHECMYA